MAGPAGFVLPLAELSERVEELAPAGWRDAVNPLVGSNLRFDGSDPFAEDRLNRLRARDTPYEALSLYRYPPGVLVDADGYDCYMIAVGDKLVAEQLSPWVQDPQRSLNRLLLHRAQAPTYAPPCLLAARFGDITWGHWLFEMLPKIVLAERFYPGRFTYLVPYRGVTPGGGAADSYVRAARESLRLAGIDDARLVTLIPRKPAMFDNLYDIGPININRIHPLVMQAMCEGMATGNARPVASRFAISRNDGGRRVLDAPSLSQFNDLMREREIPILHMAQLSVAEQIASFREASLVVGPLGSDIAGCMFMRQGARLLVYRPHGWEDSYFDTIFQQKRFMVYEACGQSCTTGKGVGHAPYHVPFNTLGPALTMLETITEDDLSVTGAALPGLRSHEVRARGPILAQLRFGKKGQARPHLQTGWSQDGEIFTWSLGRGAKLNFPLSGEALGRSGAGAIIFGVQAAPFLGADPAQPRDMTLLVNDVPAGCASLRGLTFVYFRIELERLSDFGETLRLEILHDPRGRPCDVPNSTSQDRRELGFKLFRIDARLPGTLG